MSIPAESKIADRIYYDEPETLAFDAEVTAIREIARVDGRQVWQIALDRTAFYPASGGQPFDTGSLLATSRSGASLEVPITVVMEDENGEVWHTTHKPLQEGTAVRGAVDAERRRDHTQQHSGQHLLSAVLYRDLRLQTISFHLGAQHSTIDLAVEAVSDEALLQVERTVNGVVAQALPVSILYVSQEQAENMLAGGMLRKLPPRSGRIRLIEILNLDLNACGGTHVATTAEIGPILLRGTERAGDAVRLSFVCGQRALAAARVNFQQITSVANVLSTSPAEITNSIVRLQTDTRAAAKERVLLLHSLASAEAASLAGRAQSSVIVHTLDPQQPGRNALYAKQLALSLVQDTPARLALVAVAEGDRATVVLAGKPGHLDCGTVLRLALADRGGRGGGNREIAQGSLPLLLLPAFLQHMSTSLAV